MEVIDYNGTGLWDLKTVQQRYEQYARRYAIASPRNLAPLVHEENGKRWIYPVMECVIEGIEAGDLACAEIGIEFIEENQLFSFGRILKSNTARALRRTRLTAEHKERIRRRVVEMLLDMKYLPREYRQYAKLARKIGLGEDWIARIEQEANLSNEQVRHYYQYFKEHAGYNARV